MSGLYILPDRNGEAWYVCYTRRGCAVSVADFDSPQKAEDFLYELQEAEKAAFETFAEQVAAEPLHPDFAAGVKLAMGMAA